MGHAAGGSSEVTKSSKREKPWEIENTAKPRRICVLQVLFYSVVGLWLKMSLIRRSRFPQTLAMVEYLVDLKFHKFVLQSFRRETGQV